MLQFKKIKAAKEENLPVRSEMWWALLHKTLNDPTSIDVLQKEVIDQEDKNTLIALGILEIWALSKHNGSDLT